MPRKRLTLKEARGQANNGKGWTQQQLAAASGVDQRAISKIECGEVSDPQNSTVAHLEDALELPRGTLVFGPEALAS